MKPVIGLLAFVVASGSASAQLFDAKAVDTIVADALRVWNVPGAAVVICSRTAPIYVKGHGVRTLGSPDMVTDESIFPWSSCTKALTATLIGQLVDAGKMQWDDPVRKHLPDFYLTDPLANQGVTIRDLLCHRTGLASHDELWYRSPWPQAEVVRRAGLLPPAHPFRSQFHYQSVMVTAAGLAAARAGGSSWDELVRKKLFEPIGMTTASCTTPAGANKSSPHRVNSQGVLEVIPEYPQMEPNPAGSVYGSARDLAAWLQFQLGDGEARGKRIISAERMGETHSPQVAQRLVGLTAATHPETNLMSYGLGWVIQDYRGILLYSHTGVIDGYRIQLSVAPRLGIAVGVLSNRHETRMNLAVINTILDRLMEIAPRDWNGYLRQIVAKESEVARLAREEHERTRQKGNPARPTSEYSGRYTHPALGELEIKELNRELQLHWRGSTWKLQWHHADDFDVIGSIPGGESLRFEAGPAGMNGLIWFDCTFRK
ncbi:MAG: serine hydrolase [Gemmataceae bacterium]|nr:serine hydrolase [Gemmataceae bacterium]